MRKVAPLYTGCFGPCIRSRADRPISEINPNSEAQFDPYVVDVFNEWVRKLIAKQG